MSNIIPIGAYQRVQDIRIPRSQREAGSDHRALEHTKMQWSWSKIAMLMFCIAMIAAALGMLAASLLEKM